MLKGSAESYGPNAIIPKIAIKIVIIIPKKNARIILFFIFF